jgi:Domain of unknown function (DUF6371)
MTNYRFILDKSSKKFICPQCHKKRFVKYIDTETNEYLPNEFGICDRAANCGFTSNPYKAGYLKSELAKSGKDWQLQKPAKTYKQSSLKVEAKALFPIPDNVLLHTLKNYESNNLIKFLLTKFDEDALVKQIEDYAIGTVSNYTSFPYIDLKGVCSAISLIDYQANGKRNKAEVKARNIHTFLASEYKRKNTLYPDWLTNYLQNETKFSCLFGEHLLTQYPYRPVALVEAPKTAFIAGLCYPQYVWVAVGALSYFTKERTKSIKGKEVFVFPDTSTNSRAFNLWHSKCNEFGFICIDLIEQLASDAEKLEGFDLVDYVLMFDWKGNIENGLLANVNIQNEQSGTIGKFLEVDFKPETEQIELNRTTVKNNKSELLVSKHGSDLLINDKVSEKNIEQKSEPAKYSELTGTTPNLLKQTDKEDFFNEILVLEKFFKNQRLEPGPVLLNESSTIENQPLFISTHIAALKANASNKTFMPYLHRLETLKNYYNNLSLGKVKN